MPAFTIWCLPGTPEKWEAENLPLLFCPTKLKSIKTYKQISPQHLRLLCCFQKTQVADFVMVLKQVHIQQFKNLHCAFSGTTDMLSLHKEKPVFPGEIKTTKRKKHRVIMPASLALRKATYFRSSLPLGHNTSLFLISSPLLLSWPLPFHSVRYGSDEV